MATKGYRRPASRRGEVSDPIEVDHAAMREALAGEIARLRDQRDRLLVALKIVPHGHEKWQCPECALIRECEEKP
jgi:hypothetical protein